MSLILALEVGRMKYFIEREFFREFFLLRGRGGNFAVFKKGISGGLELKSSLMQLKVAPDSCRQRENSKPSSINFSYQLQ